MTLVRANPETSNERLGDLKLVQHDLIPNLQQSSSPQPQKSLISPSASWSPHQDGSAFFPSENFNIYSEFSGQIPHCAV